jgi:hypothetical protein
MRTELPAAARNCGPAETCTYPTNVVMFKKAHLHAKVCMDERVRLMRSHEHRKEQKAVIRLVDAVEGKHRVRMSMQPAGKARGLAKEAG